MNQYVVWALLVILVLADVSAVIELVAWVRYRNRPNLESRSQPRLIRAITFLIVASAGIMLLAFAMVANQGGGRV